MTEVIFPTPATDQCGAYVKLERRAGDFAVATVDTDSSARCCVLSNRERDQAGNQPAPTGKMFNL
jgi:hypothetical protein